jgi:hypothetical protein
MAGVNGERLLPRRALMLTPPLLAVLAGVSGCAARYPCFQVVAIAPASGAAMVFDACRGEFDIVSIPTPPKKAPPAEL